MPQSTTGKGMKRWVPKRVNTGTTQPAVGQLPPPLLPDSGKTRIAILSPSLNPGGAERWMISLARWLPICGPFEILGAVITSDGPIDAGMRSEFQQFAPVIPMAESRVRADQALSLADIILVWGIGSLARFIPQGSKSKSDPSVIWIAHGSCRWTAKLATEAAPYITHWAGVSEMTRRSLPESQQPFLQVIHNGADIERCVPIRGRDETRKLWGVKSDQIAVGYIGRFSPEKRPTAVAEAISCLPENYVGVMVGGGWNEAKTVAAVRKLAPADRVLLPGYCSHVGDALAAIDVWVNCSPAEGFSLSLCEAWLAGVPVVSTPTGAIPELQQVHGTLVEEVSIGADGQEIAERIRRVTEDRQSTREQTSTRERTEKARALAWQRFTSAAMGHRWSEYLRRIVAQPAGDKQPG